MTHREINIKEGMPTLEEAKKLLEQEFFRAKSAKASVIKIIHGYGSSGIGGKIKNLVKKILLEKKAKKDIFEYISGEDWSIFNETTRKVLDQCPKLRGDKDLEQCNIGISLVVIKALD